MTEKTFSRSEIVFREGDMGNSFFQILEGTAGVYLNWGGEGERKLTEMKPGQYFGEMAAIEAWPRSTTVVALDELKTVEISEKELNAFFEEDPKRILALMRQIGGRIRTLTEEYDEVNAFLKEKQDAAARQETGFLAKLKKYKELHALAKKCGSPSVEAEVLKKTYGRPEHSPVTVTEFKQGTVIFREGEPGICMYAIQSGSVGIYSQYGTTQEQKLTTLYTNEFFGEMGMLDQEKRSATAVAEGDEGTIVEIIRPEDLEALFKANPSEVDMILRHLSNRLRRLTVDYEKACEAAVAEG